MMMMKKRLRATPAFAAISLLALSGCNSAEPEAVATPEPSAPVSIFRPEAEVVPVEAPLTPLDVSVSFAGGGDALTEAAKGQLAEILGSPQMELGTGIILRGHTDSSGFDEANLRASKRRAEAVQNYLIENGIAENRIKIIALGEMRPVAPNAKLDGTPDEEGRAANRRVDVTIAVPGAPATAPTPAAAAPTPTATSSTLVEVITASD